MLSAVDAMQQHMFAIFPNDHHKASAMQDVKAFHQAARQGDVQLIHVMLAGGMQADVKCNDVSVSQ